MSLTVSTIQTELNTIIGDSSTDRISAAERLQAITEGTIWCLQELGNDLQNFTETINYYDSVNYYKVTTDIADLLEGADLRRDKDIHSQSFTHKSATELAEEIGSGNTESAWSIERRDSDAYLVINHPSKYTAKLISGFDSTTDGGGTWAVDSTNSDATNLTVDVNEYKQGSGCFNFDIDVSQSANNKAEIVNSTLISMDLSDYEDVASWLFWVYIPDSTYIESFTLYWGSSTSAYWSATVTTDIDGSSFTNGWNRIKVDWEDATATGSPDETAVDYVQIDMNFNASQGDDTDFRLDDLILVRPERLTFHYLSYKVGVSNAGADLFAFTATTDVPYFSGKYDHLKFAVAHKAASKIYRDLRLRDMSNDEIVEATRFLNSVKKFIPSSRRPEVKNFKIQGINFNK